MATKKSFGNAQDIQAEQKEEEVKPALGKTSTLTKQDDGTLVLTVTIPWEKVQKAKDSVLENVAKSANLPGFRKGHAPKKLVEQNVDQEKIKEEALKQLLPDAYVAAVKEHNITPIVTPHIHVQKIDDNTDWTFSAATAEQPNVDLGNYKKQVAGVTANSKIVVPGKEKPEINFDEIVKILLETTKIQIPDVLITQEVDRLLSQTLNEIKSLGLSLEQYLQSTGKTAEQLREDYKGRAANDIKLELILQKIAQEENISVTDKEIDEAIANAKDEREKASLEQNKYMLASILRQQKTLDFLRNL